VFKFSEFKSKGKREKVLFSSFSPPRSFFLVIYATEKKKKENNPKQKG
jgi:hypothetical protein